MNYVSFGGYHPRRITFNSIHVLGDENLEDVTQKSAGDVESLTFNSISIAPDGSIAATGKDDKIWVLQNLGPTR